MIPPIGQWQKIISRFPLFFNNTVGDLTLKLSNYLPNLNLYQKSFALKVFSRKFLPYSCHWLHQIWCSRVTFLQLWRDPIFQSLGFSILLDSSNLYRIFLYTFGAVHNRCPTFAHRWIVLDVKSLLRRHNEAKHIEVLVFLPGTSLY